jgi:GT2 family glycosyltransferase
MRSGVDVSSSELDARAMLDELSVVIVNWNTPDLTIRSVQSLVEDGVSAERIVVVDNGSTDGSHERFERELPECPTLRFEHNVGYARAANAGARLLPGKDYLFVNNDAFVHRPGSVEALVRCLRDPSVGIVVARILNEDLTLQPSVFPVQTPAVSLVLATCVDRFLPNRLQPRWGRHWDHSESREIQAAAGPAMLLRGTLWESLRGYAESEVLYAEDIDVCWRALQRGWKVWYTRDAEFVHLGGRSTNRRAGDARRAAMIAEAEAAMTRRNLPVVSSSLALALTGCGLAGQWLCYRGAGRRTEAELAGAALRGHLAGARSRPRGNG